MRFEGSLIVDLVGTKADLYRDNADSFCKAMRAVSKYESLECAFYKEVGKVEKWLAQNDKRVRHPYGPEPFPLSIGT